MIFGSLALDQAEGAVLAHSHRLPGRVLKKGVVLDAGAIAALRDAGVAEVIAARLEPGDVPENDAAMRLADSVRVPLLSAGRAGTGRVNLHADSAGLVTIDSARLDEINRVDESLTLATLPDASPVAAGEMIATIKIIPFSVPGDLLARAETLARAAPPIALHPFRKLRAGLVLTELPGLKQSVTEGTIEATQARIDNLGGTLLPPLRCPHAEAPIAAALAQLIEAGAEILLIAGASATVDRRDVGPAGIVAAGGHIVHFGMPVDPGNLICTGELHGRPALVLPGCARSPKPNGIDIILRRLYAALPVGPAEIMRMGTGGLLKDTDARPLPRARAAGKPLSSRTTAIAALVLAAGQSTRMAPYNKLLIPSAGKPLLARTVDNILSSAARPVFVVTGHLETEIRAALDRRPVTFIHAPRHAEGLAESLKAGIAALPPTVAAVIVCLGDMPLVTGRIIDRLIAAWDPDEGRAIVVPTCKGKTGNPILWSRRFFPDILALSGDQGARALLKNHMELVTEVELDDDAILRDFDTIESLATLPERLRPALP